MKQYRCSVTSVGDGVNFFSSVDLFPLFRDASYACFMPDMTVSRNLAKTEFSVHYQNGDACQLHFSDSAVHVEYPWREMRNGETILYLAYPFIEIQRQQRSFFTAHAASVAVGSKGILLLGKVGAGKTSVAIELCRQFGAQLVANDLCVFGLNNGRLLVQGGTKFFFLRYESVRRNFPDLLSHFGPLEGDPWLKKTKIDPLALGIVTAKEPNKLKYSYLVHIDETKSEIIVQDADGLATRLYLNENFSRYIRSTCTTMLGGDRYDLLGYIPSLDRRKFYESRKEVINHLLYNLGILYISGSLSQVVKYIERRALVN